MIYVPPLHAELMSTTALTPTHHKGGGLRAIVGIAAAIAIPIAAPAIVTSLAGSMMLTTLQYTLASAVVGGALGALTAKVTGGDWKMGAIGGAIGGGIGGFAKAGGFSGIGGGADPTGMGGVGIDAAGGVQYATGLPAESAIGLTSTSPGYGGSAGDFAGVQFDSAFVPEMGYPLPGAQGQPIAAQLSGGQAFAPEAGYGPPPPPSRFTPTDPARVGLIDAADVSLTSSNLPSARGVTFDTAYPGLNVTPDARLGNVVTPPPTLSERVSSGVSSFGDKLSAGVERAFDPENLAQKGLEAAGKFGLSKAAEYFADEVPMSREEEERSAFLDQQRANQLRLQGDKENIALRFANEARSVPVSGQAEANRAKIAAARAGRSYVRQGSQAPAAVASRQRQINLAAARAGGTAQIQGRTSGLARRTGLLAAAANVLPTGQELASGAAADLEASDKRFLRLQEEQKNFGVGIFGGLLPTGEASAEERKKRSEGVGN